MKMQGLEKEEKHFIRTSLHIFKNISKILTYRKKGHKTKNVAHKTYKDFFVKIQLL